jgi:hypothetical protein
VRAWPLVEYHRSFEVRPVLAFHECVFSTAGPVDLGLLFSLNFSRPAAKYRPDTRCKNRCFSSRQLPNTLECRDRCKTNPAPARGLHWSAKSTLPAACCGNSQNGWAVCAVASLLRPSWLARLLLTHLPPGNRSRILRSHLGKAEKCCLSKEPSTIQEASNHDHRWHELPCD